MTIIIQAIVGRVESDWWGKFLTALMCDMLPLTERRRASGEC